MAADDPVDDPSAPLAGRPGDPPEGHVLETVADVEAEKALLTRAIGGWRGLFDSGLPSAVFVVVYLVNGNLLAPALWAAVATGVAVAAWRLIRRQSIQQVVAGFVGVAVSAFVAARTGQAQDFFLPGLLINVAYGAAFLISILVRWPLIGVVVGVLMGEGVRWRQDTTLRRAYAAASWIWVGVFAGRLVVQVPLYLLGPDAVGALGVAKIVMGWPLFLGAAYLTYLVLRPVLRAQRESARTGHAAGAAGTTDPGTG